MENDKRIIKIAWYIFALAVAEISLFVYYVFQILSVSTGISIFSPSIFVMLGLSGLFLLLLIAFIFFSTKKTNLLVRYVNRIHPASLLIIKDISLLSILNVIGLTVIIIIEPPFIQNGEFVRLFFVRVRQIYPLLFLFSVLLLQFSLFASWIRKNFAWKHYVQIENKWVIATLVFTSSFYIYLTTSILSGQLFTPKIAHFPSLAEAFLNGRLYLENPASTKDLSPFNEKYYVSFPPLAAILMMPFVHSWGSAAVNTAFWNTIVGALGVMFVYLAIEQLRQLGWSQVERKYAILLSLFFGFGTVQYFMSVSGSVYYISQVLSAMLLACSLWVALLSKNFDNLAKILGHALITGFIFSLILLARPNIGFAVLGIIAIQYQKLMDANNFSWRKFLLWVGVFSVPLVISVLGLGWYNIARFNSPFDFGYRYMLVVNPELVYNLKHYGQFHPKFILRNFYDNVLRLPDWNAGCHKLTPNPQGMSIFLVSPFFLFLWKSLQNKIWLTGLWLSTSIIFFTHLLYFNSGALQFGYRFSLDFTPILLLLLSASFKKVIEPSGLALIAISLINNFIGVLWISRNWCVNW